MNKIKKWLAEEKISFQELNSKENYFEIEARLPKVAVDIVQPSAFNDHFVVGLKVGLNPDHVKAFQAADDDKKQELVRKIARELIGDPNVLDFGLMPYPPSDV